MDFGNEEEFNLTEDVCDIEKRFCRFYFKVIKEYFGLADDYICLEKENKYSYRQRSKKKNDRVFKIPYKLLLLCIEDTCLGLRQFYNSMMNYEEIARYLAAKHYVTLYCVVGESFLSALGICKVIDEAIEKYQFSKETVTRQIKIIVTEKSTNWKHFCTYIVGRILFERNSLYKNIEIKLEYFDEQSHRLSFEVSEAAKEADILVMSRYLSRFQNLTVKTHILKPILRRMKELCILFYMDKCHEAYQNTMTNVLSEIDRLIEIKSRKTAYESLEDARNGEPEFPFLIHTVFGKVIYSVCIKCSGERYNNTAEKDAKDDVHLLGYSRKQKDLKISELFAKEISLLSEK